MLNLPLPEATTIFKPIAHSTLVDVVEEAIDFKRKHGLQADEARNMIYRLFTDYKLPVSLFRTVHKEVFSLPMKTSKIIRYGHWKTQLQQHLKS